MDDEKRPDVRPPWARSDRPVPRLLVQPLQEFLHLEAAGGILLLAAAVVALLWANSPFSHAYDTLWHTEFTIRLGDWAITEDLQHWINDAAMAIFFFVVGLEIKREMVIGELRDPRAAALPAFAALGGMVVPALIYVAFNAGGEGSAGWGIPMATDIAFALGVVALVAKGIPQSLKLLLLAIAIVDDIGAILVIAIFYSDGISWSALGAAAALLIVIVVLQRINVRHLGVYLVVGAGVWLAVYASGVHATIAGVVLGLLTPAVPFQKPRAVADRVVQITGLPRDDEQPSAESPRWLEVSELSREAISPLARLEHMLHPYTSYLIVPVFALANAGVDLGGTAFSEVIASRVTLGIAAGLVVGKGVGIPLAAWLAAKAGIARLPSGVRWSQVAALGVVAGIGFTVSLFIAGLAFPGAEELLAEGKLGILGGTLIAGVLGALFLRFSSRSSR